MGSKVVEIHTIDTMKKLSILSVIIIAFAACNTQNQPGTGSNWGEIINPSAERVVSSIVEGWQTDRWADATCFYSNQAQEGSKSLVISSESPASGRWFSRINVKPWTKYQFTGWIKTENLQSSEGKGAGFSISGFGIKQKSFIGDNEWTKVLYEFYTGNDDSGVIECLFGLDGKSSGKVWFDNMSLEEISVDNLAAAITVDLSQKGAEMEKYIYGQFIEHLGKCIYGGIWAEMIDDRKFWFPVDDKESPWGIDGKENNVKMDGSSSYVGDHTPFIITDGLESVSIIQNGLGLRNDISYSGHIVLKSLGDIESVNITLRWGDTESESQKVSISKPGTAYTSYDFAFRPGINCMNAGIEIEPVGRGKTWVGTISLMPDDNVKGFRADVLQLLKELDSPVYRWPGGNFVSGYNWRDGIGDRDKRPPRKNPAWTGVEFNDVGIHEFIDFCKLLGTEPYIAVNAGLGNAEEARAQVEYSNGSTDTPMGRLRMKNGSKEPWDVKWWSIGNEMYGGWQLGFMSTEEFVKKHNEFADAMRSVDKDIKLIAVGDVGKWDEMILANCSDNMDMISEHFYRQDWHGGGLMTHVKQIPDAIRSKAEAHRKYKDEIPGLSDKNITICLDEWNYWYGPHIYGELGTRYFMRDGLGIAAGINEFSRNSDIIYMANYAQTVNVIGAIKTNTTSSVMAATGQALKMYRHHFGYIPVSVEGDTRPLDIAATINHTGDTLYISAVNATWEEQDIDLNIIGGSPNGNVISYSLVGSDDMAYNIPGEEMNVIIKGPGDVANYSTLKIDPFSASIFKLPVIIK